MQWHVLSSGRQLAGSADEVRALLRARLIAADSLVWRQGFDGWEPIAAHFSSDGATPVPEPESARQGRRLPAVLGVACIALSVAAWLIYFDIIAIADTPPFTVVLVLLMVGAGGLLAAMWRDLRGREGHAWRGGALVVGGYLVLGQLAFTAGTLYHLPVILALEEAAGDFDDYELTGSPEERTVFLSGSIGDGIAARLETLARTYGGIDVLEIESPGGLIDQALAIAVFVERYGVTVVGRGHCESACVIVLVSGVPSYAEPDLAIGFHQSDDLIDSDNEMVLFGGQMVDEEAEAFLRVHGVPDSVLTRARDFRPDQMYYVDARTLVDAGALDGLVAGSTIVYERTD